MHCTQQHEHDHRQHAVRMISSVRDCAEAYCRTQRANGEQGTLGRKRTEGDCERGRQQKRTLFTRTIVGLTEPVRWVQVRPDGRRRIAKSRRFRCGSQWEARAWRAGSCMFRVQKKSHLVCRTVVCDTITSFYGAGGKVPIQLPTCFALPSLPVIRPADERRTSTSGIGKRISRSSHCSQPAICHVS